MPLEKPGSPITSNRNSWKPKDQRSLHGRSLAFLRVHRLLQIGIVGNSFRKVRTVSQIVHRLLQIGIVGNRSWISTVAKSLSGGSPITSNRNSWKLH